MFAQCWLVFSKPGEVYHKHTISKAVCYPGRRETLLATEYLTWTTS